MYAGGEIGNMNGRRRRTDLKEYRGFGEILILELQIWTGPYGSLSPVPNREAQRGNWIPNLQLHSQKLNHWNKPLNLKASFQAVQNSSPSLNGTDLKGWLGAEEANSQNKLARCGCVYYNHFTWDVQEKITVCSTLAQFFSYLATHDIIINVITTIWQRSNWSMLNITGKAKT